jgi:hypothetical protein
MNPLRCSILVLALTITLAAPAWAVDVYLNGVLITGVRNQQFENATVTLDENGNVRIQAPQYRVERNDQRDNGPAGSDSQRTLGGGNAPPAVPAGATNIRPGGANNTPAPPGGGAGLSRRYWLVAQVSTPGMVQYRVTLQINGREIRTFDDSNAPTTPIEVTEYLRRGQNSVNIIADKLNEGGRRSDSSRHWLRVVVSDGHIEGTAVVIDRPGVIFTRNAAQTDRVVRDFELVAE